MCRDYGLALDELQLACSWSKSGLPGAHLPVTLIALQLEGASFDGLRLLPNGADSPSITLAPPCTIAWMPQVRELQYYTAVKKTISYGCIIFHIVMYIVQ